MFLFIDSDGTIDVKILSVYNNIDGDSPYGLAAMWADDIPMGYFYVGY